MNGKSEKLRAFEKIVDAFEGALLHYAARLTNNAATAEDVVQNTFIKMIRNWKGPFEISQDLSSWLYRVAHNEAVDIIRNEARLQKLHSEHGHECIAREAPLPSPDDNALIAAEALKMLTDREREIVILKIYEEKSYKEIADITGSSITNVGVTLHCAMKKLAAYLERKEPRNG